ncbi:InlB B-repeat-containing protein, partial [Bifidobacterium goeldii]
MTGNTKVWRAPLAGLASLAMIATMGVAAGTAAAATPSELTLNAGSYGKFADDKTSITLKDSNASTEQFENLYSTVPSSTRQFTGWYTTPDGTAGEAVNPDAKDLAGKTLYAHYTTNGKVTFNALGNDSKLTVNFRTVGESGDVITVPLASGDKLASWEVPYQTDTVNEDKLYQWYNDAQGGDLATPAGATAGAQYWLFASNAKPVVVSYDTTNATGDDFASELKSYRVDRSDDLTKPAGYKYSDGTIADWQVVYGDGSKAGQPVTLSDYNKDGAPSDVTKVTVKAVSGTNSAVKVEFNNYAQSGAPKFLFIVSGTSVNDNKRFTAPSDTNDYTFDGFFADSKHEDAANLNAKLRRDVQYYGKWTAKASSVKLTFDPNYDGSAAPTEVKATTDTKYGDVSAPKADARKGYQFQGWNTQADGQGKYLVTKAQYENASAADKADMLNPEAKVSGDQNFYAIYLTDEQVAANEYTKTASKVEVKGFAGATKDDTRFTDASFAEYKKVVEGLKTSKLPPSTTADQKYTAEAQETLAAAQKKLVQKA